jgi:hypothetical protein
MMLRSMCAVVASCAVVCHADVVHYNGLFQWQRMPGCYSGEPPVEWSYFDITRAANQQSTGPTSTSFTFNSCQAGVTSCSFALRQMQGIEFSQLQRDITPTTFTFCNQQRQANLVRVVPAGTSIGPTSVPGTQWSTSADHGFGYVGFSNLLQLPGYIGVRVLIAGQYHYGWVRLESWGLQGYYNISEWAYESTPNTPILAGSTTTPCPCDLDLSGAVTSQDFFDFLECFFGGCVIDFNHDGLENSADFFDFVTCFLTLPGAC